MNFFPYDERYIRCHPLNAAIVQGQPMKENVLIHSHLKIHIKCSICQSIMKGSIISLIRQTNKCNQHKKRASNTLKYNGTIVKAVSTPIRAGILMDVDRGKLLELITLLSPVCDKPNPEEVAQMYFDEVAQYSRVQLADNCFWGNDSASRVTKERYQRPKKEKRKIEETFDPDAIIMIREVYICILFVLYIIEK